MKSYRYFNIYILIFLATFTVITSYTYVKVFRNTGDNNKILIDIPVKDNKIETKDILISAVGDCTIGTDSNFGYQNSFIDVLNKNNNDYSYFFSKTIDIFKNDDLSIANMEGTFTTSNNKVEKVFNFKGEKEYAKVFTSGSIEAVNLANNHTYDFGEQGYKDTLDALEKENIKYFGYDNYYIYEVKDIKIGLAGITYFDNDTEEKTKNKTDKAINYFKEKKVDLIFISYHWGIEKTETQNTEQELMGRYAIDKGADLVIGHGPHWIQGIEEYKGKYIIYSLANFVFGGNKNPTVKDTFIFQEKFHYENNKLKETSITLYPAKVSGLNNTNDYRPVLLDGEEKERVLNKILVNSNINYK